MWGVMTQAEFTLVSSLVLDALFERSERGRKEIRSWQIDIEWFEEEPLMPWRATDHEP
jgi:hypothetical protein